MPSSFSGTYGMKPTWGLVPYTGIMPIEIFVDHTGPMTANVADNALLLEVLAGDDGYDPRIKSPKVEEYTKALGTGVKGMKIAIVKEGFEQVGAEAAVNESVRGSGQAAGQSRRHGRRSFDPDAHDRASGLDAYRSRGHDPDHDVRRRLRPQPFRSLFDDADGFSSRLAWAGGFAVGNHETVPDARHLHQQQFRSALLRQGDQHLAPRVSAAYDKVARELRSAADADHADEGDAAAGIRRAAGRR